MSNRNPRHPFEPTQTAGDVDHLGLGELSTFPGGSELFWILDRRSGAVSGLELDMPCKVHVDVLCFLFVVASNQISGQAPVCTDSGYNRGSSSLLDGSAGLVVMWNNG